MKRIEWLLNKHLGDSSCYEALNTNDQINDTIGRFVNVHGEPPEIDFCELGLTWTGPKGKEHLRYDGLVALKISNLESLKQTREGVFLDIEAGSTEHTYRFKVGGTEELLQDAFSFHKFLHRAMNDPILIRERVSRE